VLIILALSLLTPYFYFIPKAALAAVIISAVIFMIEYEIVKPMWKSSRKFISQYFKLSINNLIIIFVHFVRLYMGVNTFYIQFKKYVY